MEGLSEPLKKNILDLQYNKYLQYFNTTIILLFTYIIGLVIAIFTKQVNLNDSGQLYLIFNSSSLFLGVLILLLLRLKNNMKKIIEEVKKLNIK